MRLRYVGPRPIISQHGIGFDKNEPDKYLFLHTVIELLEVVEESTRDKNYSMSNDGVIDLRDWEGIDFSHNVLNDLIKKHCDNVDDLIQQKDKKSEDSFLKLTDSIRTNSHLSRNEKIAWLENLKIMHNYYIQFIENEFIYEHMIKMLVEDIRKKHVREIFFPLHRNYGYVMSHLHDFSSLAYKKSLESKITIEMNGSKVFGKLVMK